MVGQEYIPWYAWNPNNPESGKTASLVPQKDNARDFYNTGITSNTNVAFSKGWQGAALRVSYTNQMYMACSPIDVHREPFVYNLSAELNKHFILSANLNYSNTIIKGEFDDAYKPVLGSFTSWFHRDLDMNVERITKISKHPPNIPSWNLGANPDRLAVNSVQRQPLV
jgi:hypothetical protein